MTGTAAVIVAHPDDETLWCAGTMLMHPEMHWTVLSMCRRSDPDRAPKFSRAIQLLHAVGIMADLDDGPEQEPLPDELVQNNLFNCLPDHEYELGITHSPYGEYTRHRRHEEIGRAVMLLWQQGKLAFKELWMFAYEDGNKEYLPRPRRNAQKIETLQRNIWMKKYQIITEVYGFSSDSFEARTTPKEEAFWRFTERSELMDWYRRGGGGK